MRSKFQDFGNTHFAEKPPFLRSSLVRRPPFVRRRANKQWPYRRTTGPTHTLRFHSSSFLSSSSSCSRNWWQMASTRLDNWPLLLPVLGRKIVNLPPKDPQFRPGYQYANSLRWVPRRGKSIIKWGHRMVLEAIWGGFWDDCCHTSGVGSQDFVSLTVSYFIVILLFRRI